MLKKMQGPSDTYRDVFEPGWREKEAERDRMLQAAFEKVPMNNPADEINRLRAEVEARRADARRLAFLYGPDTTDSLALYELELRVFNDDWPTLDEVRAAIDAAIAKAEKEAGNG
jgi:hypothetical protein